MVKRRASLVFGLTVLLVLVVLMEQGLASIVCSVCGRTVTSGSYYKKDGRNLCPACWDKSRPRCSVCGAVLTGKFYRDGKDRMFCVADYQKRLPVCVVCHKRIEGKFFETKSGQVYCPADYNKLLPVCCVCGERIKGTYFQYGHGRVACNACSKRYPSCDTCRVPVARGGRNLGDGRVLCDIDARTAVMSQTQADGAYNEAVRLTRMTFGSALDLRNDKVTLKMLNKTDLLAAGNRELAPGTGEPRGFCHSSLGILGMRHTIFFLNGLSRDSLVRIFVHERAHAFMNERNSRVAQTSAEFKEGFAQWAAYKVAMRCQGAEAAKELMRGSGGEYRTGLEAFLAYEKRVGAGGVITAAKSMVRLP